MGAIKYHFMELYMEPGLVTNHGICGFIENNKSVTKDGCLIW